MTTLFLLLFLFVAVVVAPLAAAHTRGKVLLGVGAVLCSVLLGVGLFFVAAAAPSYSALARWAGLGSVLGPFITSFGFALFMVLGKTPGRGRLERVKPGTCFACAEAVDPEVERCVHCGERQPKRRLRKRPKSRTPSA